MEREGGVGRHQHKIHQGLGSQAGHTYSKGTLGTILGPCGDKDGQPTKDI